MKKSEYREIFDKIISKEPALEPLINEVRSIRIPPVQDRDDWIAMYRKSGSLEYKQT